MQDRPAPPTPQMALPQMPLHQAQQLQLWAVCHAAGAHELAGIRDTACKVHCWFAAATCSLSTVQHACAQGLRHITQAAAADAQPPRPGIHLHPAGMQTVSYVCMYRTSGLLFCTGMSMSPSLYLQGASMWPARGGGQLVLYDIAQARLKLHSTYCRRCSKPGAMKHDISAACQQDHGPHPARLLCPAAAAVAWQTRASLVLGPGPASTPVRGRAAPRWSWSASCPAGTARPAPAQPS